MIGTIRFQQTWKMSMPICFIWSFIETGPTVIKSYIGIFYWRNHFFANTGISFCSSLKKMDKIHLVCFKINIFKLSYRTICICLELLQYIYCSDIFDHYIYQRYILSEANSSLIDWTIEYKNLQTACYIFSNLMYIKPNTKSLTRIYM